LLLAVVLATSIGTVRIAPLETASIILRHLHLPAGRAAATDDIIVWDVRLPRVLTAGLVGAALSLSGASYQAVFRNPLADPYLIGVAAGASLGATVAIVSPLPLDFYNFGYVALFAFVGAMAAVAITYELARVGRTVPVTTHILAGVAVSAAASAGSSMLFMLNEQRAFVAFTWLYGDFTTSSWHKLALVSPYVAAAMIFLLLSARSLNALQAGDDEARTLGIRVERLKAMVIIAASLATAVCVAISGLIGFVGLVVPHACRMLFGPDHRALMPASMFGGAIFLIAADLGARTLLSPQEIPVGILTAVTGAPFFLFLLRRQRRLVSS
jgi:iron complex transport system permease protein